MITLIQLKNDNDSLTASTESDPLSHPSLEQREMEHVILPPNNNKKDTTPDPDDSDTEPTRHDGLFVSHNIIITTLSLW